MASLVFISKPAKECRDNQHWLHLWGKLLRRAEPSSSGKMISDQIQFFGCWEDIYIYIYVPSFLIYYESLLILTALPKINLSENVLFISEAEDICIVFLLFILCCLGISHVHIRGLELQEMGRLTAGTHCTHKEHMWTGCITKCDSTILSDFGNTNMVWAHVDPF